MKQNIKRVVTVFVLFFAVSAAFLYARDIPVTVEELPQAVLTFIKTHFPQAAITIAVKDSEGASYKYEIKLDNRVELDFNAAGKIIALDGAGKLPDSVIPAAVLAYVRSKFPENYITDWTLKKYGQEIELDNGLELKFNRKGDFIKIDN